MASFYCLLWCLLLCIGGLWACTDVPQCSYNYRYILVDNSGVPISFYDAENYCLSNYGSHLASIHKYSDLLEAQEDAKVIPNKHYWIGLTQDPDYSSDGSWVYTDGTAFDYPAWAAGEPSGDGNCVYIGGDIGYLFNDFSCEGIELGGNSFIVTEFLCANPQYDEQNGCKCNCDKCLIEGDPHITTFDQLEYHFMGQCSYYYVTSCYPNNHTNLPFEIVGSHVECFPAINGRTCLDHMFINLYDNNELVQQILLSKDNSATYTSAGSEIFSGSVPFNTYITWDDTPGHNKIYYLTTTRGYLDFQIYIADTNVTDQIMDARIILGTGSYGLWSEIYITQCYLDYYQVCGLCGYYDANKIDDFTYYDIISNEFITINDSNVSDIRYLTIDALNRTNTFGNHYIDLSLSTEANCTINITLTPQSCINVSAVYCSAFWTQYCPCRDPSYYTLTWSNDCIFDSCASCPGLSEMNYTMAVQNGCLQMSNKTCQSNCKFTPSTPPTFVPTTVPTSNPTTKPTTRPTFAPTNAPSSRPTNKPSNAPTSVPTFVPTFVPTAVPSQSPTTVPSPSPTAAPIFGEIFSVCEFPSDYLLDVIFIQDISCKLSNSDCFNQNDFIGETIESIKSTDANPRIGYVEYNSTSNVIFDLTINYNSATMFNILVDGDCTHSTSRNNVSNPYAAISQAINIFETESDTSHVKYIVLVADCIQNVGINVCSLSSMLNLLNINVIVVDFGTSIANNTYQCLSSQTVYYSSTTNLLDANVINIQQLIVNTLCSTPAPSSSPTNSPTKNPTNKPSNNPTNKPSNKPSNSPTNHPTNKPTNAPSSKPTNKPTNNPTYNPTNKPTNAPTHHPTNKPTNNPTNKPTNAPSNKPSNKPSNNPTYNPTNKPSNRPTYNPTHYPTNKPTNNPTPRPSNKPTNNPTTTTTWTSPPTKKPTNNPTTTTTSWWASSPTNKPTSWPTIKPTLKPTSKPSSWPTNKPTGWPTNKPTLWPTSKPTKTTNKPTSWPTSKPTIWPTSKPTIWPTSKPTKPTNKPTSSPTTKITLAPTPSPISVSGSCDTAIAYDSPSYSTCFSDIIDPWTGQAMSPRWGWSNGRYTSSTIFPRTLSIYAGAGQCVLSKGTYVGKLIVNRVGCQVTVTYQGVNYVFTELHLYVGTDPVYVIAKGNSYTYTTAWGLYPNSETFNNGVSSYTFTISDICDDFYVVADSTACP